MLISPNKRVLRQFGLEQLGKWRGKTFIQFARDVADDILDDRMIGIVGKWGMGKTLLFNEVKRVLTQSHDSNMDFVRIVNEEKERITISSIVTAMLLDLLTAGGDTRPSEPIRRDLEARSRQLQRIMGQRVVGEGRKITVFIENAHRLHPNTIRAIKDLRELDFNGQYPLFSVVLIGHPQLGEKMDAYGEVRCRTTKYELNEATGWMTYRDRIELLKAVYGEALSPKVRELVSTLYKSPLAMCFTINGKMEQLAKIGATQVKEDAFDLSPYDYYYSLKEDGITMPDIADAAGVALGTVHNVISGNAPAMKSKVMDGLKRLSAQRIDSEFAPAVNQ